MSVVEKIDGDLKSRKVIQLVGKTDIKDANFLIKFLSGSIMPAQAALSGPAFLHTNAEMLVRIVKSRSHCRQFGCFLS